MSDQDLRPCPDSKVWGTVGHSTRRTESLSSERFGAINARPRAGRETLYRGRLTPPPPSKVAPTRRLGPFSHGIRVGLRPPVGSP